VNQRGYLFFPVSPVLDVRWRTIAQGGEGMRDPDLHHPDDGSIYAVSDEWLWHPPEGPWAYLAGAGDAKGA
jgi:hypothetical protein